MANIYFPGFDERDRLLATRIALHQNARRLNNEARSLLASSYNDMRFQDPKAIEDIVNLVLAAALADVSAAVSITYSAAVGSDKARVYVEVGKPVGCKSFAVTAGGGTITATVGGSEDIWAFFDDDDWFEISNAEDEENNGLYQVVAAGQTATLLNFDGGTTTTANATDTSMRITKVGSG